MKVLIISSNALPAAPTGPVYVTGAVREAGHTADHLCAPGRYHERGTRSLLAA
jgi:hypothetical protein